MDNRIVIFQEKQVLCHFNGWNFNKLAINEDAQGFNEKGRNVYFMFEDYKEAENAQKTINSFKKSNQNHAGFSLVNGLGDDAFFHTDSKSFYSIIVRKGKSQ